MSPVLFSRTHSSLSLDGSTHWRSWSTGSIVWTKKGITVSCSIEIEIQMYFTRMCLDDASFIGLVKCLFGSLYLCATHEQNFVSDWLVMKFNNRWLLISRFCCYGYHSDHRWNWQLFSLRTVNTQVIFFSCFSAAVCVSQPVSYVIAWVHRSALETGRECL